MLIDMDMKIRLGIALFFLMPLSYAAVSLKPTVQTQTNQTGIAAPVIIQKKTAPTTTKQVTKTVTTANKVAIPTGAVPVGKVVWVKGMFKGALPKQEPRMLQQNSIIFLHDTLTTEGNTQAQIIFTDQTLMTFRANSKFVIDKYSFDPKVKKGSTGKYFMNLIEGGFRTITGLIAKGDPNDYQVNTPVATIGVRGTDFEVALQGAKLQMMTYSGSPCVTSGGAKACLDKDNPYATVPSRNALPVRLKQKPAVFKQKLPLVKATIKPFVTTTTTSDGKTTTTTTTSETTGESSSETKSESSSSSESSSESSSGGEASGESSSTSSGTTDTSSGTQTISTGEESAASGGDMTTGGEITDSSEEVSGDVQIGGDSGSTGGGDSGSSSTPQSSSSSSDSSTSSSTSSTSSTSSSSDTQVIDTSTVIEVPASPSSSGSTISSFCITQ